jgi:hypothetical protein
MDDLDREFKEHMVFVFNQVAQNIRKTGWSAQTVERAGKLLRRLYLVFIAYKKKKKKYTAGGWLEQLVLLGNEAASIFG